MSHMKPGDHISWKRTGYTHHAIVVEVLGGGKLKVIEYIKDSGIEQHDVDYVQGGVAAVVEKRPKNPKKVIQRARSRIGEDNYVLFCNNCEHFANWCITGISESPQAERYVSKDTCNSLNLAYRPT